MEHDTPTKPNRNSRYHNPPPVTLLRSQFAAPARSNTNQSTTSSAGAPRYFSSPFRAPLNQQERHESFLAHQKSLSGTYPENQLPKPPFAQTTERSSYTFFEPQAAVRPLNISKQAHQASSDDDKSDDGSQFSQDQSGVVRQASIGHKAKPSLTDVKRSDSTRASNSHPASQTPPLKAMTNALNASLAAVSGGAARQEQGRTRMSRNGSGIHQSHGSPTSMYSEDFHHTRKSYFRSGATGLESGRVSPLEEEVYTPVPSASERQSSLSGPTPISEKSSSSIRPLLGLGIEQNGMSSRIPEGMRPPKLNIKAVRDMEARGSITSLPDLIRRATKLASNLDRGKTASRLDIMDMFNTFDSGNGRKEKGGVTFANGHDVYSDNGSEISAVAGHRPTTMWPGEVKDGVMVSEKEVPGSKKTKRKCCGLSMTTLFVVLVVVIILIAAAVLIPIFLVVIPRQVRVSSTDLKDCSASYACHNNGVSVVDNNACSCICVDGFTGSDCSELTDPNCDTADLTDGGRRYENATVGSSIKSVLLQSQTTFKIPVNSTALLAVFAKHNLTCAGENSLVRFSTATKQRQKRLIIVPGLEPVEAPVSNLPVPTRTTLSLSYDKPSHSVDKRADTQTSNEIVYQTASAQASPTGPSAQDLFPPVSTTVTGQNPSSTGATNITNEQLEFAQVAVLYILAESRVPSTAVLAQQKIEQYIRAGALKSGNSSIDLVPLNDIEVSANFTQLALVFSNGTVVGGHGS